VGNEKNGGRVQALWEEVMVFLLIFSLVRFFLIK
jgi:hypothetical protein